MGVCGMWKWWPVGDDGDSQAGWWPGGEEAQKEEEEEAGGEEEEPQSDARSLENMVMASGKFGGVAGVFLGVHI